MWVATGFVLIAATLVIAFLSVGEYARKARVIGFLAPDRGVIRLVAPLSAIVVEVRVREGQPVRQGDTLFVLAVGQSSLSGDTQAAVESSLTARQQSLRGTSAQQSQLEATRLAALDRRLEAMQRELGTLAEEQMLQRQRQQLAEEALAQYKAFRAENYVSDAQVRSKSEDLFGVKAQLIALERQRAAHLREIASLQAERRELPLRARAAQGEIDRDLAVVAAQSAENAARQRIVVRAPQDGTVSAVVAEVGQSVSAAGAMASLIPADTRLQAQLFAPSSAIGFVRPDQTVMLRYQAFPYQKFGHQSGQVVQVSKAPLQPTELAGLPLAGGVASGEPLYRITVRLDKQDVAAYGSSQALAPGMQLDADVVLDRRRLIEWIFEPVLGIASRV
ncbi:MAG: HlyD family efflux transporter periplasmic adaptor subunit [Burkholderiales bacterium]|nr:HlyD family efflux transporter periplasmic adaptor subunit [Burkholderiales bacterium]